MKKMTRDRALFAAILLASLSGFLSILLAVLTINSQAGISVRDIRTKNVVMAFLLSRHSIQDLSRALNHSVSPERPNKRKPTSSMKCSHGFEGIVNSKGVLTTVRCKNA